MTMKKYLTTDLSGLFHKFFVDFETLLDLPCHVYIKNEAGTYIAYNEYGSAKLGFSLKDIIGKNDFDIFPSDIAELYSKNDKVVFSKKTPFIAQEKGILKNNTPVIFESHKIPLCDATKKMVGVLGISFPRMVDEEIIAPWQKNIPVNNFIKIPLSSPLFNFNLLSNKEKECLHYLCQGLTIKMIAKQLKVSPHTVATYISRAKIKMGHINKTQLICIYLSAIQNSDLARSW